MPKTLKLSKRLRYNFWEGNVFQNPEVPAVRNNIIHVGGNGTIYKLIVIGITGNQPKVKIDGRFLSPRQFKNYLGNVFAECLTFVESV